MMWFVARSIADPMHLGISAFTCLFCSHLQHSTSDIVSANILAAHN